MEGGLWSQVQERGLGERSRREVEEGGLGGRSRREV